jgi:hypothetical protein
MARSVIRGIRNASETPEELIQDYINFLKSQPREVGGGTPASVGFLMTQHTPAQYGPGAADKKPEVIFSLGWLRQVGNGLGGTGTRQSSNSGNSGFAESSDSIYVQLDPPGTLNATGAAPMTLSLHHDVLVGSTIVPVESTSPGSVATVMLWAIPAYGIR